MTFFVWQGGRGPHGKPCSDEQYSLLSMTGN